MKAIAILFATILGVAAILGLTLVGSYNGMTTKEQQVNQTWSQVQNVYQRRFDLIPNLVATVKGAAQFEQKTFTDVAAARASVGKLTINAAQAPATAAELAQFQQAQGQLGSALSRLMAVSEAYPQLKATEGFNTLQAQLEGTENRISVERRNFNTTVQDFNTTIKRIPAVLWAGIMGFKEKPYFQADEGAAQAPKVSFDLNQ